jgi:radical SAM superfamily enzyme YgiQ (UPF0313 family)
MKIALIYPRLYGYKEKSFGIGGYARIMLGYPPLSLAYVAAIIKKANHEAIIIDGNILNLDFSKVIKKIKEFSPDLLGFSVTTSTFHNVLVWVKTIKRIIKTPIIVGGALLDLYPEEVMQHKEVDYAIAGSSLYSLPEFLKAFSNNKDLTTVPGLYFRIGNKLIINEEKEAKNDINELPFPARALLPNHRYYSPFSCKKNFTALLTSKGCMFRCAYCCLPERLQLRRTEDVIEEMTECYYRFNIRDIDFYDSVFSANKERTIDLCQKIREKKFDFTWTVRTHINCVDGELLKEMSASGCRMIMYGIESTNQLILKNLNRPAMSINRIRDVVSLTRRAGISSFGFFMLGSPGETRATIEDTFRVSRKLGFDFVQFSRLTVIPGTQLYEDYLNVHKNDYWSRFIHYSNQNLPDIIQTQLPTDAVIRYVKKANLGFYLAPWRIIKIILRLKSYRQLINHVKAGVNMLLSYMLQFV